MFKMMPGKEIAKNVVKKLQESGHLAYFAGGWVRDYLMQHPSDDIDIATSAPTGVVEQLFRKTIPIGVAFGIVVVVEEGHAFEVATFRKDRGYVDGRRPLGIDPANPEEDAQRRDFTINGMFYDPIKEEILDFVGGQKDLKKGVIRAIGNPHERFAEDRLRMMRAVRYSTRFNFPIESETLQAILAHARSLLPAVAMERVWQEFKKMAHFSHFDTGLVTLHQLDLLPTIFPKLEGIPVEEIQDRVRFIEKFPKETPTIAQLLELFPGASSEELKTLCSYLKLSNSEKEFVEFFSHATRLFQMPPAWLEKLEPIEWVQFYAHPHSDLCLKIAAAHLPEVEGQKFLEKHLREKQLLEQPILRLRSKAPIVRAQDLKAEGIAPGKKMGLLLKEAERISVNQGIESREKVLEILKKGTLWN